MFQNMRIAFVIDSFNRGGKERRCLQLIQGLNHAGFHDIMLIVINNDVEYEEIYGTSASLVIIDRKNKGKSNWLSIKELYGHLQSFIPDVVMAWSRMSASFIDLIRLRHKFHYIVGYIADCNTPQFPSRDYFIHKLSVHLCDKAVGNSHSGLKAYGIPQEKAVCIYNGFNINRLKSLRHFNPLVYKAKELHISTPYIVSMVARVEYQKDYRTFIAVARHILSLRKDVTFLAIGKGEMLNIMRNIIKPNEIEHIRFLGHRTDIEQLLAVSTVSVLLTDYHYHAEGISNSLIESMAIGIPVIATKGGGSSEIITHGENGFLIEHNDIEDTAQYIIRMLDDEPARKVMGKANRHKIATLCNLETTSQQYINLFLSLLK